MPNLHTCNNFCNQNVKKSKVFLATVTLTILYTFLIKQGIFLTCQCATRERAKVDKNAQALGEVDVKEVP